MMGTMANKQLGVSLTGFLGSVAIFVMVVIVAVKLVPPYVDDATIKSKFIEVAHDPDLQKATEKEIRESFFKRITVSNITVIRPEDVGITRDAGGITLSASYSVKIPVFGNATLVLEFNPSSSSK